MTHFSLCSGIGGLDLAAEWAGFRTIAQCEIDDYASKVLAKNFPGVPNLHDIRTVTNERLGELGISHDDITVISAGFPCQPYSLAGKGRGDRDERDLWGEVARVLGEVKPRWFVGENTPGLFARENQRYFRRILNDLAALGYRVGWGIWGAYDVGAPHKRDRVFILAHRNIPDTDGRGQQECGIQRVTSVQSSQVHSALPDASCERKAERRDGELRASTRTVQGGTAHRGGAALHVSGEWWQTEPDVGRVAHGVPSRVDKLRCLGNAVVPAQAYPIFKAIADYEKGGI